MIENMIMFYGIFNDYAQWRCGCGCDGNYEDRGGWTIVVMSMARLGWHRLDIILICYIVFFKSNNALRNSGDKIRCGGYRQTRQKQQKKILVDIRTKRSKPHNDSRFFLHLREGKARGGSKNNARKRVTRKHVLPTSLHSRWIRHQYTATRWVLRVED